MLDEPFNIFCVQEKLDSARIAAITSHPTMECVNFVLQYVNATNLEQLVPRLVDLIKSSPGLVTKEPDQFNVIPIVTSLCLLSSSPLPVDAILLFLLMQVSSFCLWSLFLSVSIPLSAPFYGQFAHVYLFAKMNNCVTISACEIFYYFLLSTEIIELIWPPGWNCHRG